MNSETGHLVKDIDVEKFLKDERSAYSRLPLHLADDAATALAGADETYINLRKRTPLAKWAAMDRRERQKREKDRRERREQRKREKRNRQEARRRR